MPRWVDDHIEVVLPQSLTSGLEWYVGAGSDPPLAVFVEDGCKKFMFPLQPVGGTTIRLELRRLAHLMQGGTFEPDEVVRTFAATYAATVTEES